MRAWRGTAVVLAAVVATAGCATRKAAVKESPKAASVEQGTGGSAPTGTARWIDEALGFQVTRPNDKWQVDVTGDFTPEGIATPVVMRNQETGAQVVIQVAPAVASPVQFAERLTEGMRSHPGFQTTDPEPVAFSDSAVGFRFAMGDKVNGRVAVLEGTRGRVLMMLATWPSGAPEETLTGVEEVFRGVQPLK
ncbi:MAG: hypothetical protein IRZ16_08745 [Myxococcaceae bacterium]|nr:hypothetical protein [Myxococcaceae bacterium]